MAFLDDQDAPPKQQTLKKKKKKNQKKKKAQPPETAANNAEKAENSQNDQKNENPKNAPQKGKSKGPSAIALKLLQRRKLIERERKKQMDLELARQRKLQEEREEELRLENEEKERKRLQKQKKKEKVLQAKKEGTYMTPAQRKKKLEAELAREQFIAAGLLRAPNSSPTDKLKKKTKKKKKERTEKLISNALDTAFTQKDSDDEKLSAKRAAETESETLDDWENLSSSESEENTTKSHSVPPKPVSPQNEKDVPANSKNPPKSTKSSPLKESKEAPIKQPAHSENQNAKMRAPICCVLGHVDTGKTKLLDRMRNTAVQDNEVGGITQQIGASFFPREFVSRALEKYSRASGENLKCRLPGLLVIDTPGHESFSNLRKRGSTLCDIAVLVVDIMHGVEPQTEESLRLLKSKRTPFVVALNKIDRIYGWEAHPGESFVYSIEKQKSNQKSEFRQRLVDCIGQISAVGLNCALYTENTNYRSVVSLVPTSAITGEGIPDLLSLLVRLTQTRMAKRLELHEAVECSILEVRRDEGLGHTADVILSSGTLSTGDRIVLGGFNGPIVTTIRSLYEPSPLKEIRFKGGFKPIETITAAAGVKICANDLEHAVAGSRVLSVQPNDDEEALKKEVMRDYTDLFSKIDSSGKGVCVQSSTLGALEAFLEYLRKEKIPVHYIAIGPIRKKDVVSASVMLDKQPEYACILAFNVKVDKEIDQFAEDMGVTIFKGEIIYNLRDMFVEYLKERRKQERKESKEAIMPVLLSIIPEFVIMKHNPIILGCKVESGKLLVGTPLAALHKKWDTPKMLNEALFTKIGVVESIEKDKKKVEEAVCGDKVAVKIASGALEGHIYYGRQFDSENKLCSVLTRNSIDVLKQNFKEQLKTEDWKLVIRLKKVLGII